MKLDEILAEAPSMPTGSSYVCLDGQAVGEIQELERERSVILTELAAAQEAGTARARKASAPATDPRITAIDKQLDELDDRRRERSGYLHYVATDGGAWTRWCAEHPPREDNQLDAMVAKGYCNAEDLIAELGKYVTGWADVEGGDPEPINATKWAKLSARLHPRALWDIASGVVALHARAWAALPKSQSESAQTRSSATA